MLTENAHASVVEPLTDLSALKRSVIVPEPDFDAWLARFDWTWRQAARGEFPAGYSNLSEFQLGCICADPVLWAQSFLREPTDPDHKDPYNFFDYQLASIRYSGNLLHEDGSEVGKTREIVPWTLWQAFTVRGGSGLIGAPESIFYLEIIDAMLDQLSWNDTLARGLKHHRKQPHNRLEFTNGFKIDFRPSGFDGSAYRGVHVRSFAIKDEAVKDKPKKTWSEFYRAALPGCKFRFYSVPDGDRDCEFYRLCAKAPVLGVIPPSPLNKGGAEGGEISSSVPPLTKGGAEGRGISSSSSPLTKGGAAGGGIDLSFVKINWPKTLMPPPFWSDERRHHFIDLYGGETSPGYQHNVQGEWGDPESTVFPSWQFLTAVKEIPDYRTLKVVVDGARNEVIIRGESFALHRGEDGLPTGVPEVAYLIEDTRAMRQFFALDQHGSDFQRLLKGFFRPNLGANSGGADFGYSMDPTEIRVWTRIGKVKRVVARLHLEHVDYDQQAEALDALDDIYDNGRLAMSWGLDYGNAGTAVGQVLTNQPRYAKKCFEYRVFGVMFESTCEAVDEDGEVLVDQKTEKPVKKTSKELATDLLISKIQAGEVEQAPDPDVILSYTNHTSKEGSRHRIFSKSNDHILDADRLEYLAEVLSKDGGSGGFSCGASLRPRA